VTAPSGQDEPALTAAAARPAGRAPREDDRDDAVPVSVRLGAVIPPEDPEDWTRPLTWVAASGMLLAPLVALVWFVAWQPATSDAPLPGTWLLAAAVVIGGVLTGVTQIGPGRAFAGTLGAGLLGSLLTVIVGGVTAGERQVGTASPTVTHAVFAVIAGLAGVLAAATLMPALARLASRWRRALAPGAIGVAVAALVVQLVFSR
jgi:hypothetical protein